MSQLHEDLRYQLHFGLEPSAGLVDSRDLLTQILNKHIWTPQLLLESLEGTFILAYRCVGTHHQTGVNKLEMDTYAQTFLQSVSFTMLVYGNFTPDVNRSVSFRVLYILNFNYLRRRL